MCVCEREREKRESQDHWCWSCSGLMDLNGRARADAPDQKRARAPVGGEKREQGKAAGGVSMQEAARLDLLEELMEYEVMLGV